VEFESINTLVSEKQLKTMENIIETLAQKIPQLIVTPIKYGKIGNEILASFKVNEEHYQFIIEKLTINGIQVVTQDERAKQFVDIAKTRIRESGTGNMMHWGNKNKSKNVEKKSIDELSAEGDYAEVIRISRDITLPKEESNRAKLSIDRAIQSAISIAYSEAYSKKIDKPWGYEIHWVPEDRPYLGKIEHIEAGKERKFLSELIRVCKKKGEIILSTPSESIKMFPGFMTNYISRKWGHDKCNGYSKEELKKIK